MQRTPSAGVFLLATVAHTALMEWPDHLAVTKDGYAWFTEYYSDRVGRAVLR